MKALIGTKLGMTQLFDDSGNVARVTLLQAGPCVVTQIKTMEKDGYSAVQLGFGKAKKPAQAQVGHQKGMDVSRVVREVRTNAADDQLKAGDQLDVTVFEPGDAIQVTATSKGKGFAGTVKRHNFTTGPKTHGSHNYRQHGSIGSGYPEHVFKGLKMAGQMGHEQVTVRGLKVVIVDPKLGVLAVSGAVPGPKRGVVMVKGI